jgi:large conductance mechanosensitive channel
MDPAQKARTLAGEFRSFAFKGNVVDLAVGVIIGAAFGKIVTSLVDNIIMPLIGVILPGQAGYQGWSVSIGAQVIPFGKFIGDVVNFLIVALALFLFTVKFLGGILKAKAEPPPPTKEQELLTEIRDLLKKATTTADDTQAMPVSPEDTQAMPVADSPTGGRS